MRLAFPSVWIVLAMAALLACQPQTLPQPVPEPTLDGAEEAVRREIHRKVEAVRNQPEVARLWGELGMVLEVHGYDDEAQAAYRTAASLDPTEVRWPYYLAALLETNVPAEAVTWFELALAQRPAYAPGHIRLAQTRERLAQPEEAAASYRRAIELEPRSAFAHLGLGTLALDQNQLGEALGHLRTAFDLAPDSRAVISALARCHFRRGETAEAARLAELSSELSRTTYQPDPLRAELQDTAKDPRTRLRRAVAYKDLGQLERALEFARGAASELEGDAQPPFVLAEILEAMGRFEEAREAARQAFALAPERAGLAALLARLSVELQDFDEAEQFASRALADDPNDADMHLALGRIAWARGAIGEATESMRRAVAARPQEASWCLSLAGLLMEGGGSTREARELIEGVLEVEPDHPDAWLQLGYLELRSGDLGGARLAFERVLRSSPNENLRAAASEGLSLTK